jgi:type VI secretion system protein ImpL
MLKKALKLIFFIFLLTAAVFFVYFYTSSKMLPWWTSAVMVSGIIALIFVIIFLKKYLARKKEKKFIEKIISHESFYEKTPQSGFETNNISEKWLESVELLKKSKLKKIGNPLYVLPWYMVLGEPGCGKTSCIKNSGLYLPVTEVSKTVSVSGTKNFDWWFFQEAIILDTAGRYTIPVDEQNDLREWQNFLTLVCKYRKKEPLNGIIAAVSAEDLLKKSSVSLNETGHGIRKRIDQIMRSMGSKIPVYIMVTKTDLINGMTDFSMSLHESSLTQAMGFSNPDENSDYRFFLDKAFNAIAQRLKDIRLLIANKSGMESPGFLIFPEEFEKIYNGLEAFLKGIFEKNHYQEDPMFRGIYFSSALQNQNPESEFIKNFNFIEKAVSLSKKNIRKSIFLTDFFKTVITKDRNIFYPIKEFLKWKKITAGIGIISWIMIFVFICGIMGLSFWNNSKNLLFVSQNINLSKKLSDDISVKLIELNDLREKIRILEQRNKTFLPSFLEFDHSKKTEEKLKQSFSNDFKTIFLSELDKNISSYVDKINYRSNSVVTAKYIEHLISRIIILENLNSDSFFKTSDNTIINPHLSVIFPNINKEIYSYFINSYIDFIKWNNENDYKDINILRLRNIIEEIIQKKGQNLFWIAEKNIKYNTLYDLGFFWGKNLESTNIYVDPAFTVSGKKELEFFLNNLKKVLENDRLISQMEKEFYIWYEEKFLNEWLNFALSFPAAQKLLVLREDFKNKALEMTMPENPYFNLIKTIDNETKFINQPPIWLLNLRHLVKASQIIPENEKKGLIDNLKNNKNKVVIKLNPFNAEEKKTIFDVSDIYHEYLKSLESLRPVTQSAGDAYAQTSLLFTTEPGKKGSDSDFYKANDNFLMLINELKKSGDTEILKLLLKGPLDFLTMYSARETSCLLQEKWDELVIGPCSGINDYKIPYLVFNKENGFLWDFLNGPGKPFIGRNQNGFFANSSFNNKIDFNPDFLKYISKGSETIVQTEPFYYVDIKTLPLDINKDASIKPYGAILRLNCTENKSVLENYNYPDDFQFKWSPASCGDTELEIKFKNFSLIKKYIGNLGFAEFLNDFKDGVKVFEPKDFEADQKMLESFKIKKIIVSYNIKNSIEVIKLLQKTPEKIPPKIADCWGKE